jgi:hypothetical protein
MTPTKPFITSMPELERLRIVVKSPEQLPALFALDLTSRMGKFEESETTFYAKAGLVVLAPGGYTVRGIGARCMHVPSWEAFWGSVSVVMRKLPMGPRARYAQAPLIVNAKLLDLDYMGRGNRPKPIPDVVMKDGETVGIQLVRDRGMRQSILPLPEGLFELELALFGEVHAKRGDPISLDRRGP